MKKTYSKTLLCCGLFVYFFTAVCFSQYGGGSGTPEDPYLIYTAQQFNQIGLNVDDWDKHFALMSDVNMADIDSYNIIGDYPSYPFTGVFDGRGHRIHNFWYFTYDSDYALFSYVSGPNAHIKNLGLIDVGLISDAQFLSLLVSVLENANISNCWINGGYVSGFSFVGGFVAENRGGLISNCYAAVYVAAGDKAGGIVALNSGTIENCYFVGYVNSEYNDAGTIAGYDTGGEYISCFWDKTEAPDISGLGNLDPDPAGVMGKTTVQMQNASTYLNAGWELMTPSNPLDIFQWRLCQDGTNYPRLATELYRGDFGCPDGVDEADLAVLAQEWLFVNFEVDVDFHQDNQINLLDFAIFANAWQTAQGEPNWNPAVDIAEPYGQIDELDLNLFLDYWLADGASKLQADIEPYGGDGFVDWYDFARLAANWLKEY
ncbi:MAG: hypothetical protein WCZ89_06105 [Phycisphaerae bacterium]